MSKKEARQEAQIEIWGAKNTNSIEKKICFNDKFRAPWCLEVFSQKFFVSFLTSSTAGWSNGLIFKSFPIIAVSNMK